MRGLKDRVALDDAAKASVRALVVSGAGNKAFCAGADRVSDAQRVLHGHSN